ncbi:hypothetical protein E6W17_01345 [Streptomyces sp. A1547]|nr:hypothetical protein E6W17_01345 [Streptomyces sp. A1547]
MGRGWGAGRDEGGAGGGGGGGGRPGASGAPGVWPRGPNDRGGRHGGIWAAGSAHAEPTCQSGPGRGRGPPKRDDRCGGGGSGAACRVDAGRVGRDTRGHVRALGSRARPGARESAHSATGGWIGGTGAGSV